MLKSPLTERMEAIGKEIVDGAFTVHVAMGPGLLESVYEEALCFELASRGLNVVRQKRVPLYYKGHRLGEDLRADIVVEDCIIIEVKAVEKMLPVHEAQILSYMKLSEVRLGYLINFNVALIKDGISSKIR